MSHKIQLKYINPKAFTDPAVATCLSNGDDTVIKVQIDKLVRWNLTDSMAGIVIRMMLAPNW